VGGVSNPLSIRVSQSSHAQTSSSQSSIIEVTPSQFTIQSSHPIRRIAQVDLSSESLLSQLPPDALTVHIRSCNLDSPLSKLSPFLMAKCLDALCGAVADVLPL
jgi:hypothetical protein